MKNPFILLASGILLIAGCAMPQLATTRGGATLILTPEIVSGGPTLLEASSLQPYSVADVNRLVATLFIVEDGREKPVLENGTQVTREVLKGQFGESVVFSRLRPHTTYRVKTEAWGYPTMLLADSEDILLSTDDADSTTAIVVTDDDRPTVGKLKVRLKAPPFSGETGLAIDVTDGVLVPAASESLSTENVPV